MRGRCYQTSILERAETDTIAFYSSLPDHSGSIFPSSVRIHTIKSDSVSEPVIQQTTIGCRERLGGLLKYYCRA